MIIAVRIPSLDGLRAVSISMVLVGHALFSYHGEYRAEWSYLGNGDLGVSIFFVISGFLITELLLREFEKTATLVCGTSTFVALCASCRRSTHSFWRS